MTDIFRFLDKTKVCALCLCVCVHTGVHCACTCATCQPFGVGDVCEAIIASVSASVDDVGSCGENGPGNHTLAPNL